MVLSDEQKRAYAKRLLLTRMRILLKQGFYGLMLMHTKFALDDTVETAATNGETIMFSPAFLDELSDSELEFILMHEIMHIVLEHCARTGDRDNELFNIACDIVVNSNILQSNGMNIQSITLRAYGESMHKAPDGKEGFEYTAEQVYDMLVKKKRRKGGGNSQQNSVKSGQSEHPEGQMPGSGNDSNDQFGSGKPDTGNGRSEQPEGQMHGSGNDSNDQSGSGKPDTGNGRSVLPDGQMPGSGNSGSGAQQGGGGFHDDHSKWGQTDERTRNLRRDIWRKRLSDACEAISVRESSKDCGGIPIGARRLLQKLHHPQTDWRTVLQDFVQEEITDYSFMPPDRRMDDCPFFLPDFNEKDDFAANILFMIDTSGSMSDDMIASAYSEIKGAIDQFNGRLAGWLGFFDAEVVPPKPFADEEEFRAIRPEGGGGTRFDIIFDYVREQMQEQLPVSIIILTDGYAPFPGESEAIGIPVLWLLNNQEVTPPWGRIARIQVSEGDNRIPH